MKFLLKRLLPLLLALLMLPLVGCDTTPGGTEDPTADGSGSEGESESETIDPGAFLELVTNGKSEYKIIYPEESNDNPTLGDGLMAGVNALRDAIKNYTGAKLSLGDDFLGHSTPEGTYEILIGKTNREASEKYYKELRQREYLIAMEGTKLVIIGSNASATRNAVTYFINKILSVREDLSEGMKDGTLRFYESEYYKKSSSFTVEKILIDGVDLNEYRFVIPADGGAERWIAGLMLDQISALYGSLLEIVTDEEPAQDHEILVGNTNRTTVQAQKGKYLLQVTDKRLEVVSDTPFGLIDAYWELMDSIVTTAKLNVDLKKGDKFEGTETYPEDLELEKTGDLRIMYHNIVGYSMDQCPVYDRADMMLTVYQTYAPDIIGWQEAHAKHRSDERSKRLMNWLAENYVEICYPSEGGRGNPIFYSKDAGLTLLESGYSRARSGDKGTTWAVFQREDGTKFAIFNSHFAADTNANNDHTLGNQYRADDATNLVGALDQVREKYGDITVIAGGDYNSNPSSQAYNILLASGFVNVRNLAGSHTKFSPHHAYPTYNANTKVYAPFLALTAKVENAIDHIMHTGKEVTIHYYRIASDSYALTTSDHAPHYIDITFN